MVLADGTNCKMQLWDTAGQERFRAMAPVLLPNFMLCFHAVIKDLSQMYYRNAAAAIVCFDITNEDSFTKMKDWVEELKQNVAAEQLVLAIACNKADLESLRVISRSRAEQFAQRVNAILYETSAKENFGVEEIFKKITEEAIFSFLNSVNYIA
jgi:Ras-related protein Rab-22